MMSARLPILAIIALCYIPLTLASLSVTLSKGEEKCFIFRTPNDDNIAHITGSYDVLNDALSMNPVTSTLFDDLYEVLWHSDQAASEGTFTARGKGRFHLCFGNGSGGYKTKEDHERERKRVEGHHIDDDNFDYQNYDGKDRQIAFNVRVKQEANGRGTSQKPGAEGHSDRILGMTDKLKDKLDFLMDHQEYIKTREVQHRDTMEKTFSLLMKWTILEGIVLVIVATSQVIYFRKFFETKRYL